MPTKVKFEGDNMDNFPGVKSSFFVNLLDVIKLLEMTTKIEDGKTISVVYKSSVVISVAYWEKYIEDLLSRGCDFVAEGLRNPLYLPKETRKAIVESIVKHDPNSIDYINGIWDFSGEGWTKQYKNYVDKVIRGFNTADSKNVKEVFSKVFGIQDVFQNWTPIDPSMSTALLDQLLSKRHQIAHGSSEAMKGVDSRLIISSIHLLMELAEHCEKVVWSQIVLIVKNRASGYGLRSKYIYDIITYFKTNGGNPVSNKVFQRISQTANSNYKKLTYAPWGLLEIESPAEIKPTDTLQKFIKGEVVLPEYIVVLKSQVALPKSNTRYISFQELENQFINSPS